MSAVWTGLSRKMLVGLFLVACAIGTAKAQPPTGQLLDSPEQSTPPGSGQTIRESSLLAHWTFDDLGDPKKVEEKSGAAELTATAVTPTKRVHAVHGRGIQLVGQHALKVEIGERLAELAEISFSTWVRPTDLSGYREIFRQECAERLLFSFQHGGTILSLGLNIDGYVECDAQVRPELLLDGAWHHCAATYDGQWMCVYLDGQLVGQLERPGSISTNLSAPGFIGSSGGGGEFLQGSLDELQIYREALTAEQILKQYRSGTEAVAHYMVDLARTLPDVYLRGASFAETLADVQSRLKAIAPGRRQDLAGLVLTQLKADFSEDYNQFITLTEGNPFALLLGNEPRDFREFAERLVLLMLEYRPITDEQRQQLTDEQRLWWDEVGVIESKYQRLLSASDGHARAADWIQVMLDAGRRVTFRPRVNEAVAPYVTPSTPVTCDLTAPEADAVLRRDWLHQAGGKPTLELTRQELHWTRQLIDRLLAGRDTDLDLADHIEQLQLLTEKVAKAHDDDRDLYFQVRRLKRSIIFANPLLDFDTVLFVDMPFPQGSEWQHETRHRLGYMAVPGARLLTLTGLSPAGQLRQLMPQPPLHGAFWRPDLDYDAQRVVFCFKPHNEKSFHLYEINVDGTELKQLTTGPYDDLDPIYLPDGQHIAFSTTRGHTYVRCMPPTNAYVLARCQRDGKDIYLISRNNEPDYLPSVLNDGRIIYTRWEYTDKPLWRAQGLWTVNPDGTRVTTFWGNQSVWPDLLKDARSIPGSRRVMFTGSAHHNWFSGSVGIIDPERGANFPDGVTKVTAELTWPESGNGPVDPIESPRYHRSGHYDAYYSPYPLSDEDFLVSANRGGKFVLYLMDVEGNRELIYEGEHNILHAMPVRRRPRPPVLSDLVAWPSRSEAKRPKDGTIYSRDVFEGMAEDVRSKGKYLRVLNIEPKSYTYWYKRPYISTGPVVSAVQSDGVKRILGTVPIEADGSVAFSAPAGVALHFQIVDEQFRALQTMRSFTGVMPGETRGCLGCHEQHGRAPEASDSYLASLHEPSRITPPPWGVDSVSYVRYVQPVLDRYCGECHQGDGEARETLDLTLRPGFLIFNEPYMTLTGRPAWGQPYERP